MLKVVSRWITGCAASLGSGLLLAASPVRVSVADHEVQSGEVASLLLFKQGVGKPDSPFKLYGRGGWLKVLAAMNPTLNVESLEIGQTVKVPRPVADGACQPGDAVYVLEEYQLKGNDDLSTVLYARGVGTAQSDARLFGRNGWIARNQKLNPHIKDIGFLPPNATIHLLYPDPMKCKGDIVVIKDAADPEALKKAEEEAKRSQIELERIAAEKKKEEAAKQVVAEPEKASLTDIASIPPEEQAKIPPAVIAEKLDETTVAKLDDETIKKIPPAAIEEKAAEVSIFDAGKPGLEKLFSGLSLTTPAAYFGARVGFSIAERSNTLLSKAKTYGLIAEIRSGTLQGVRLLYETLPRISASVDGNETSLQYSRLLLGYAFEFKAPYLFDLMHITPRAGYYDVRTHGPVAYTNAGKAIIDTAEIKKASDFGIEIDAEFARYFYVARFWAARDLSVSLIPGSNSADVTRVGVDGYLKGSSFQLFGTKYSPSYLLFIANESMKLKAGSDRNVGLDIPTAGVGFTVNSQ